MKREWKLLGVGVVGGSTATSIAFGQYYDIPVLTLVFAWVSICASGAIIATVLKEWIDDLLIAE